MILEKFPSIEEFYSDYWGKKPFIVRGYVAVETIESLIDGDSLAGLALENEIRSRIITNNEQGNEWSCEHGPFDETRFDNIGDKNWSLLVQNVEQYHKDTALLFENFHFSPRWLIDDIMVSFSAPGGSVGPHTDSYHTFLVQGIGKRAWKISDKKIEDDSYAENLEMKVLKNGFDGETYEVTAGDVIYMPPFFGHEGKTIDVAMTFSVGFLGPKLSDILGDYAQYLEANDDINKRFLGENLNHESASFMIGNSTQDAFVKDVISSVQSNDFNCWMAEYFSKPSHDEIDEVMDKNSDITPTDLVNRLKNGATLYRPEHIKLSITSATNGDYNLGIYGEIIHIKKSHAKLIDALNKAKNITIDIVDDIDDKDSIFSILCVLNNQNVLIWA